MAKETAPPKITAGGGFGFEDKVVAYFLACLLTDTPPLDSLFGTIQRLDFQVHVDGWHLDDVLLTLGTDETHRRCALSVKSNQQFLKDSAPIEFVQAAWETFLIPTIAKFDKGKDLIGLTTSPLDPDFQRNLHELLSWARMQDAKDLARRVDASGYGNELKRSLLKSFACPAPLVIAHKSTEEQVAELLQCVQHLSFDFEQKPSHDQERAVALCRNAIASGQLEEARQLWDTLCAIANEYRPNSGFLNLLRLLNLIRGPFHLKAYPQHATDWTKLKQLTRDNLALVPDNIGNKVRLSREKELTALEENKSYFTAIIGPSGCGKSVLTKCLTEHIKPTEETLWFNAQIFLAASFADFENKLSLQNPLTELFEKCPASHAILVIDGLDRQFDPQVFCNVVTFIKKLFPDPETSPWRVILTSQPEEWTRLLQELTKANLRVKWSILEVQEPQDLSMVWAAFPKLQPLLHRPELKSLLFKPSVLDLLATRIEEIAPEKWVGESDLIKWLWDHVIAKAPRANIRAGFVNALGERQGDDMRSEIPLSEFPVADLAPLDELVLDRICTTREGRAGFHHDRYGDWARQRALLSHINDLNAYLEHRIESPAWHPAVRLLGLHLLEQSENIDRWSTIFNSVGSSDTKNPNRVQDLLLESVIFAASPLELLERLWPELAKNNGFWLNRLLTSFLHVATFPHPSIGAIASLTDVQTAAHFRVPYWPYWLPILKFLYNHSTEVVLLAPEKVSEISDGWLRYSNVESLLRREASELGLAVGRYVLQFIRDKNVGYIEDDFQCKAFRAALAGARELSNEVASFALDAAERIAEGQPRPTHIRTQTLGFGSTTKEIPPPWPDGPLSRVSEAFSSEVLGIDALAPLIISKPDVAREVLLAALIEEPIPRNPYDDGSSFYRERLHIRDAHNWFPPFYTRGPFLLFLTLQPQEGLEVIIRLINFAFDCWKDALLQQREPIPSVKLRLDDNEKELIGDYKVYTAYRDSGAWPHPIVSALMALEKWFYNQIDSGKAVDEAINTTLQRSNSVALIGVLNAVGCRQPSLFTGALRPLLSVPEFHNWEITRKTLHETHSPMIAWQPGSTLLSSAYEWHSMPHRQEEMSNHAMMLFLKDLEIRAFLEAQSLQWEKRQKQDSDPQMAHFLKQLAPRFRIKNYSIVESSTHKKMILYEAPEALRKENEEKLNLVQNQQLLITFPFRCSKILEDRIVLNSDELSQFWDTLQRISILPPVPKTLDEDSFNCTENSICGGIAVLFELHSDWLELNIEKKNWCLEKIKTIFQNPPPYPEMEFEGDISDYDWRSFSAHIIPILWSKEPEAPDLRWLMAVLCVSRKYKTVEILFNNAAKYRSSLGASFIEFQEFLCDWALVRAKCRENEFGQDRFDPNEWLSSEINAFKMRQRKRKHMPWSDVSNQFSASNLAKRQHRGGYPEIDFELIKAAYAWLPSMGEALDKKEHADWLAFWKEALSWSIQIAKVQSRNDFSGHNAPHRWDLWLFRRINIAILQLDSSSDRESLWKPVMLLEPKASHWIESFLREWFLAGLGVEKVPPSFAKEWRKIVEFAYASPHWLSGQNGGSFTNGLWMTLLGLDEHYLWIDEHKEIIGGMQDFYEKWWKQNFGEIDSAVVFCQFLNKPAAEKILCKGIIWIADVDLTLGRHYGSSEIADYVASLLAYSWEGHSNEIRLNTRAFEAFKKLLKQLLELQNSVALELNDRMRE